MPNAELDPYDCDCGWLERAANDPSNPIWFDAEVNEYYLRAGASDAHAQHVIRFCPWCGGDAPVSHRDTLFEVITPEESIRVTQLWKGLGTREDVVKAWGPPNEYIAQGFGETEKEEQGKPTRTVYYDVMRYNNLSSTAVIDVILCAGERVLFSYSTKPKAAHEG
jgi:hypothetical protein